MSAIRQGSANDPEAHSPTDTQVRPEPTSRGRGGEGHDLSPDVAAPISALGRFRRIAASLLIADACCILGALFVANRSPAPALVSQDLVVVMIVAPIVWVAIFHSFGLYGVRHLSAPEELRRLIGATSLGVVIIMVGSVWWEEGLDRSSLAMTWLVAVLAELLVHRVTRWHIRKQRRSGNLALRTLIVGTNDEAMAIAHALAPPVRGYVPLGFVGPHVEDPAATGLPILGTIDDLAGTIQDVSAECVFVASTATSPAQIDSIARSCRRSGVEMRVSANAPEMLTSRVSIQQMQDLMILAVRPVKLSGPQSAVKRTFDIAIASLVILLFFPLLGLIALAIRVTSSGPVLFRQVRVTKGGRPFTMFKFRTMVAVPPDVPESLDFDLTKPFFKLRDDPRLTSIGRVIRSTSLDELPQLWNVLRGDMSMVGPRPLPIAQVSANLDLLQPRHEVRAGITGWWQISGRSDIEPEEALKLDLFYIENWSLALDLYVLAKTAGAVVQRRGAY